MEKIYPNVADLGFSHRHIHMPFGKYIKES